MNNEKSKFEQLCWYFISEDLDICEIKLSCLLYYCQAYHLVFLYKPLYNYNLYATEKGVEFKGEALYSIRACLEARDWMIFWLRYIYYLLGYLDYFKEKI